MYDKKQEYQEPIIEVVTFDCEKIMTVSGEIDFNELEDE